MEGDELEPLVRATVSRARRRPARKGRRGVLDAAMSAGDASRLPQRTSSEQLGRVSASSSSSESSGGVSHEGLVWEPRTSADAAEEEARACAAARTVAARKSCRSARHLRATTSAITSQLAFFDAFSRPPALCLTPPLVSPPAQFSRVLVAPNGGTYHTDDTLESAFGWARQRANAGLRSHGWPAVAGLFSTHWHRRCYPDLDVVRTVTIDELLADASWWPAGPPAARSSGLMLVHLPEWFESSSGACSELPRACHGPPPR
jgi:hypothetical protein